MARAEPASFGNNCTSTRFGPRSAGDFAGLSRICFDFEWQNAAGRLYRIVAGGASAREGAAWGVKDTARSGRMAEHIEICRRLWSEQHVTFNGKYHSFHDVTIEPQPIQQPCPLPTRNPTKRRNRCAESYGWPMGELRWTCESQWNAYRAKCPCVLSPMAAGQGRRTTIRRRAKTRVADDKRIATEMDPG